ELVITRPAFDAWLEKLRSAELIAFDTETTSIDAMRADIVGISFAVEPGKACYITLGQHAKYDINILSHYGITVQGVKHDSMLESYVWNATATRHDMDSLAKKYLGYETVKYE